MVVEYDVREMNKEWENTVKKAMEFGTDYAVSVIANEFGLGSVYNWANNRKR